MHETTTRWRLGALLVAALVAVGCAPDIARDDRIEADERFRDALGDLIRQTQPSGQRSAQFLDDLKKKAQDALDGLE